MTQNITAINPTYALALIGNYLPRRCGIATFTTDLAEALASEAHAPGDEVIAVAMTDIQEGYAYPGRVKYSVSENVQTDYLRASEFLNTTHHDAVILQHEYGIFGGEAGAHILHLVKNLRSPLITTLHSVLLRPSDSQKRVLLELGDGPYPFGKFVEVLPKAAVRGEHPGAALGKHRQEPLHFLLKSPPADEPPGFPSALDRPRIVNERFQKSRASSPER